MKKKIFEGINKIKQKFDNIQINNDSDEKEKKRN